MHESKIFPNGIRARAFISNQINIISLNFDIGIFQPFPLCGLHHCELAASGVYMVTDS